MALSQQIQEGYANKTRDPAPQYRAGDKVWLNLKNYIHPGCVMKKFDSKNAKYTVTKVLGSHAVRLNIPGGRYLSFYVDLLRPAATDPRPSQAVSDPQPEPITVNGASEWEVKYIITEHTADEKQYYVVKWIGYSEITWEPEEYLSDAAALDIWENMNNAERQELRQRIRVRPFTPLKKQG